MDGSQSRRATANNMESVHYGEKGVHTQEISRDDGGGGDSAMKKTRAPRKSAKRPGLPSCCCLVWEWEEEEEESVEEMQERGRDVRCRDMRTPEELRDFISSRAHDAVTPPAEGDASGVGGWRLSTNTVVNRPSTGSVTAARGGGGGQGGRGGLTAGDGDKYHPPYKRSRKPLIILHGLPSTFVRILLDSEALGIDPEFIEAHAGRRGYRPMGRYRRLEGPQFACWTYPELVRGFKRTLLKKGPTTTGVAEEGKSGRGRVIGTVTDPSAPVDLNSESVIRAVSDCEDLAVVFCRASLWKNGPVGVLFLDRPVWEGPSPFQQDPSAAATGQQEASVLLRKARKKGRGAVTKPYALRRTMTKHEDSWDVCLAPAKEIPSFEEAVHDTLAAWSTEGPATEEEDEDEERNEGLLMAALEETAYQKWLDFFEVLTPRQHPLVLDGTSLEWRVLQALEGNLVMARDQQRRRSRGATATAGAGAAIDNVSRISLSDWSEMIQRLRLRVEILPTVPAPTNPFTTTGGRFPLLPPQRDNDDRLRPPYSSPEGGNGNNNGGQQQEDSDNQRALDRVTYLGGILLPISIVSGVLSMNEDFEPGSPLFWVFWVAALPLTGLSVVLIYADKLRRAEVWVQVVEQEQEQEEGPEVVDGKGEEGSSSLGEGGLINWGEKEEEKVKFRRGRNKRKKAKQGKQTRYDGGYMTGLERIHPPQPVNNKTDENTPEAQSPPANFPDAVTYGGLMEGDDIVIDLSGAIQQGQEPQTISVEPPPPPPPPPPPAAAASPSPPPESEASEAEDEEDEDEESSEDEDEDEEIDEDDRRHHVKPITWRRKELGWGGAAMCILKMQKPPNMRPS